MKSYKLLLLMIIVPTLFAAPIIAFSENQDAAHKTNQYVDDSVVTAKVKSALMADAGLKSFDINVKTYNGKVQLCGFVDTKETVSAAEKKAKAVEGVKSVANCLLVK